LDVSRAGAVIRSDLDRARTERRRARALRAPTPFGAILALVLLVGLALRLHGVHNPILDHPGWRQGDMASVARNFARLDFNPLHPQTDYDGPAPNYVELELQIVPFLAASLYKLFGIHEIFGRLISIGFSLGTVVVLGCFARFLFRSEAAGIAAALALAIAPGSVYYGRTFMPDTTMTFFLSAALFATARLFFAPEGDRATGRGRFALAAALTAVAVLAKPVALLALLPIAAMSVERYGLRGTLRRPGAYALVACAIVPYALYDHALAAIAEWHWASGITRLHVLPGLRAALVSPAALIAKLRTLRLVLGMLPHTMLGGGLTALAALGLLVCARGRSRSLLPAWLAAGLLYAFVVVTVERVDYYLYPFVPLAALLVGALAAAVVPRLSTPRARSLAALLSVAVAFALLLDGRRIVAPYYVYNPAVYRAAHDLDLALPPDALVVMGHYDPSVLYLIGRKGWEEDPYAWTPFDEQSAIRKGSRFYIDVEHNRFKKNVELYAWMQRFPVRSRTALWPLYETDPTKIVPGAEERWRAFRARERAGAATP